MYKKILLCYNGTMEGRRALRQGAEIAMAMGASAYLLAICRDMIKGAIPEAVTPELVNCERETAVELLNEGVRLLKDRGVPSEGSLVYGDPLVHIPQIAQRIGADLIVVGYRPRSRLARWWSEDDEAMLLHKVSCSLLVTVAPPA